MILFLRRRFLRDFGSRLCSGGRACAGIGIMFLMSRGTMLEKGSNLVCAWTKGVC